MLIYREIGRRMIVEIDRQNERIFDESIELADNAMLKHRKELFYEWDFDKNDELGLDVYKATYGGNKKVWWKCLNCKSSYDMKTYNKVNDRECPYCSGRKVNDTNSLASIEPELLKEWNYSKNKFSPQTVFWKGSKIVAWRCSTCKSLYDMKVRDRTVQGNNCPYCAGVRVNHTNSLASLMPDLASEWHPTKNEKLSPDSVTLGSGQKVWWLSKECGHWWDAVISKRTGRAKSGCPYCATSNARLLVGFNDMWTTNPKLAGLLANPEDGYKHMQMSSKKLDWTCLECGITIKNKTISDINVNGLSCPKCSDGVSYPEKFMMSLLTQASVEFTGEEVFDWSNGRRYDFYIPSLNMIIETHGRQHYEESFSRMNGRSRTLKEEQENDKLKYSMAINNKISNYIVVDCRESTIEWIKNSILDSDLGLFLNIENINWQMCHEFTFKTLVKEAARLWNSGVRSATEIGGIIKASRPTARKYLRQAAEIGWCDYDAKEALRERSFKNNEKRRKPVVQLTVDGLLIREWDYSQAAQNSLGIERSCITLSCLDNTRIAGGFRWMYKTDYNEHLESGLELVDLKRRGSSNAKKVIQLDLKMNLVKKWSSLTEASNKLGISIGLITSVCRGRRKTTGGFKWMYAEDYKEVN